MGSMIFLEQVGENVTFTPQEWLAFQSQVNAQAFDLGYKVGIICLVIGFAIGSISVYLHYRRTSDGGSE